jgi:hypothetical protein
MKMILAACLLAACWRGAADRPAVGRFTAAQFASLRWIEGTWRGHLPDGGAFYERYRFVDDSTIAMRAFADSTLTSTTDSARIALRDGMIADEGGAARWAATRLDSTGVAFTPIEGATNAFTWTRNHGDRWSAALTWTDTHGEAHSVTYPMERVGS